MEEDSKRKIDYWSVGFSIISIIFANLTFFINDKNQKYVMLAFTLISLLTAGVIYYINKINSIEKLIFKIKDKLERSVKEFKEKINYIKELYEIKLRVDMLEKRDKINKRGQINLLDIIKIIVAIILIYVIFQVIKSL